MQTQHVARPRKMAPAIDSSGEGFVAGAALPAPGQTAALWAKCVNGDEDAAVKLFARYLDRLKALAGSRLSQRLAARVDAEDVVMSAYRSLFVGGRDGRFDVSQPGDLWRLLAEIALHKVCRQAARHTAQRRSVRAECHPPDDSAWEPHAREPSPAAAAASAEELETILARLPPAARRVVELRLQGESPSAIAAERGCSERTVRRHLAQARQMILQRQDREQRQRTTRVKSLNVSANHRPALRPTRLASPATFLDLEAPLAFSDFLLQRQLGAGGVGKVYRAIHRPTGMTVAVKYLRKSYLRHPQVVARFLREARLVSQFDHPGIVRVRGLGRTPNRGYFLVMDLMPGGDLARRTAEVTVSTADVARWMPQIAAAVAYAHERGVIHCDLKPSNVLLDGAGNARVADFGLAVSPGTDEPGAWSLAGTPAFMAPEQIDPVWGRVSPRTDVFGLGAILFALLTGQPPHPGRRAADVLARAVSGQPVAAPSSLSPGVAPEWEAICVRCLAKHPDERMSSAVEFCEAVTSVLVAKAACGGGQGTQYSTA
jgi:RNA polymerase sigma factor (sigma-70 family)